MALHGLRSLWTENGGKAFSILFLLPWISSANGLLDSFFQGNQKLKIEDLGFGGQINQMRTAVQDHIGKEFGLVHLTGLGAGDSDPDGDLLFHQIGQVVVGTVSGRCLYGHISRGIGPLDAVIDKEEMDLVPFGMGDLAELKASGGLLDLVLTQDKQKFGHKHLL